MIDDTDMVIKALQEKEKNLTKQIAELTAAKERVVKTREKISQGEITLKEEKK